MSITDEIWTALRGLGLHASGSTGLGGRRAIITIAEGPINLINVREPGTFDVYDLPPDKQDGLIECIDLDSRLGPNSPEFLVWSHPQATALEMLTTSPEPGRGSFAHMRPPWKFSETPLSQTEGPPVVGEHTEEILKELGYSDRKIKQLEQAGVVLCFSGELNGG